jgi:alpha-galactosidase/6-phospho-beta-glucosidase family protein
MPDLSSRSTVQYAKNFIFIGASYRFDHRIIRDFLLTRRFNGSTFTIVDIDPVPLKVVTDLANRMVKQSGQKIAIRGTVDMEHALNNADFVFPTFSIGGDKTWDRDAAMAYKFGIVQPVADTTGPAGIARALREVPLAVEIASHLRKHSPRGRIINLSNPMSVLTAAMARHSSAQSVLGLSHAVVGCRDFLAKLYKVPLEKIELMTAGVNHLTWVMQVLIDGHDHTDRLEKLLGSAGDKKGRVADYEIQRFALSLKMWRRYGFLPVSGDSAVAEFFPQFTRRGSKEVKQYRVEPRRTNHRREKLKTTLEGLAYGKKNVPDMDKWSGEGAHALVLAMLNSDNSRHTVNMPHDGALGAGIVPGALVECMANVNKKGATGVSLGDLPPAVRATTQRMNAVHDLTVEAALEGNRAKVIQALLLDPSVVEFDRVPLMADYILKENKQYLPRFWQ